MKAFEKPARLEQNQKVDHKLSTNFGEKWSAEMNEKVLWIHGDNVFS